MYGGIRIVHGDSCLCHNGRLYVIIRYLLYFLFQCKLFVISKRYTLCRINFLIDNRNPVYITRGSVTEELSACIADPTAAREAESREIAEALNSFLSTLPVDARLFFMRRYWYMDSVKAIAEKYGCGESRVKTSLHRTREKLRD